MSGNNRSRSKNKTGAAITAPASNVIHYDDGLIVAEIVIRRARTVDGVMRGQLVAQAESMPSETMEQRAYKALAMYAYPQCVTCIESGTVRIGDTIYQAAELPLELFSVLPEDFVFGDWLGKVEEMNPSLRLPRNDEKKSTKS